jgi:Carbamoyl-phosphate synthase L chain, ATP binding domain
VRSTDELEAAFERCRSEAGAALARAEVYVEEFLPRVRHIEVQILGDRQGGAPPAQAAWMHSQDVGRLQPCQRSTHRGAITSWIFIARSMAMTA